MSSERWQRVAELFGTASTLPPDQRSAYLDDTCGNDPDLRRELEALLAAEGAASEFLRQTVGTAAREAAAVVRPSLLGRRIGPYEVTRELGHGGMGTVYLAVRADDAFQKTVAIKLLRPGADDAELRRRFLAERQILADLDHPHIARLLDGGATEDGLPYVVMEHVEGEPLGVYCDRGALSVPARLQLFLKVCDAVQDAHAHQIVHRDLKPGNILVTAAGEPKLLDFGIAKLLDAPTDTPVTRPAERLMTREYASPEQVRGEAISTATDVYSLGVVLYELLTGKRPYAAYGDTAEALERAICERDPARPSTLRSVLSGDLDAIVLMALRKEPARRYASVQQLADDIRRHLDGLPVRARRGAFGYRAARFVRRHRARLATAALLALAAVVWAVRAPEPGATDAGTATPADRRIAVLPFVDLSRSGDQQFLSDGITEELLNALGRVPRLEVVARTSSFRFRDAGADIREIAAQLGVDAVVAGSVRREGNRIRVSAQLIDAASARHIWSDVYARELDDLFTLEEEVALAIAGALRLQLDPSSHPPRARMTERGDAHELYLRGRHEWNRRSESGMWRAIDAFKAAIALDPEFARAYAGLADAYGLLPAYANVSGPELLSLSKAAALRAVALDSTLAEAHAALAASVLEYDHDRAAAAREGRQALRLDPRSVTALRRYGLQLAGDGAFDSALVYVERARRLDPLSPVAIGTVATVHYFARRSDAAGRAFGEALALQPDWATGHAVLGRVHLMAGKLPEAVAELERAVALSGGEANDRALLATAYAAAGRTREARRIARDLASGEREFVPAAGLAALYVALGDEDTALAWLHRALELRDTDLKYLRVDPRFDPLRGRPAFAAILRRVGLS